MMIAMVDSLSPATQISVGNVLVGLAVSTSCALVGCFLVLRRMSLLGDAISHAVLPGLVIGFMISGTRDLPPMLIGAVLAGLLTTYLTQALARRAQLDEDAGMGIVFTSLFALGVILITSYHSQVDLDPGCVLYGALETSGLDTVTILGLEPPRQLIPLSVMLLIDLVFVLVLWKELKISSFDPALATTLGLSAGLMHYVLMTLVACTTVASFEAVGSILVIAMLIVPGATAHLLTDRLGRFVMIAVGSSWVSTIGGYALADTFDTNAAGMMTVASGALFGGVVLVAPRHGLLARWTRNLRLGLRIVQEDLLSHFYRYQEREHEVEDRPEDSSAPVPVPVDASKGTRGSWLARKVALRVLLWRRDLEKAAGLLRLTPQGLERARQLIRTHRVWESFLQQDLDLPLDHLHEPAHRMEHYVTPELADRIVEKLEKPDRDPHGRKIP